MQVDMSVFREQQAAIKRQRGVATSSAKWRESRELEDQVPEALLRSQLCL